ncbi:MAG: AMP-binding protein [Bacteroidales bacterium]|nr:AMP-binding protein [Bacteroidales bacterium]
MGHFIKKNFNSARENYVSTLSRLYEYSTTVYSKNKLSCFIGTETGYTYASFKKTADSLSKKLAQYGISAGDRVAILSQNMPNWTAAFFSITAFGRIAVPILPDSSENEVTNILAHSESKAIFVSKKLLPKLCRERMDAMTLVIDIENFELIKSNDDAFTCDGKVIEPAPDDIAAIIYTSGTTGNAKGVILSHRNLVASTISSYHCYKTKEKDSWLSILPMPHTYEMTIGMIYPMYVGACVYYMSKPPTPTHLLSAMKEVRPTVILTVPLIIEKVFKSSVLPTIKASRVLSWMDTHMHTILCRIIGHKLRKSFGGRLGFFGVGGAKLNPDVEAFLKTARFPYYIGYGLTECAPLLAYACFFNTEPGAIGIPVRGVELKLHDINPETGEGEIVAKGDNIMLGYYKDPSRTRAAFTEDGWFRTNDLACVDKKGRYFIKGRLNNMVLGPSGENIYPEEIEKVINDVEGVNESIVMERGGHLVALVQFDEKVIDWDQAGEDKFFDNLEEKKKTLLDYINKHVNKTSKVSSVEVVKDPFEKTATQKIRRFKYKDFVGVSKEHPDSEKKE